MKTYKLEIYAFTAADFELSYDVSKLGECVDYDINKDDAEIKMSFIFYHPEINLEYFRDKMYNFFNNFFIITMIDSVRVEFMKNMMNFIQNIKNTDNKMESPADFLSCEHIFNIEMYEIETKKL